MYYDDNGNQWSIAETDAWYAGEEYTAEQTQPQEEQYPAFDQ